MRLHLDTDVGTNPDDVAALAMLLGAPGVDLVGVTTSADGDGTRAAVARHVLVLAGRGDVPVTPGTPRTSTGVAVPPPRHLPPAVQPCAPGGADSTGDADSTHGDDDTAAATALAAAVRAGATLLATGPLTNLAAAERIAPGTLAPARVVVSGGWTGPPPPGLPRRSPDGDSNLARDTQAARGVTAAAGDLTFVPLALTHRVVLLASHLPRLRAGGPLCRLLADLAVAHASDTGATGVAARHAGVPDDLVLFLHDPVACAVALGWPCVATTPWRARLVAADGGLLLRHDPAGRVVHTATSVDADRLVRRWLAAVLRADENRRRAT